MSKQQNQANENLINVRNISDTANTFAERAEGFVIVGEARVTLTNAERRLEGERASLAARRSDFDNAVKIDQEMQNAVAETAAEIARLQELLMKQQAAQAETGKTVDSTGDALADAEEALQHAECAQEEAQRELDARISEHGDGRPSVVERVATRMLRRNS